MSLEEELVQLMELRKCSYCKNQYCAKLWTL